MESDVSVAYEVDSFARFYVLRPVKFGQSQFEGIEKSSRLALFLMAHAGFRGDGIESDRMCILPSKNGHSLIWLGRPN